MHCQFSSSDNKRLNEGALSKNSGRFPQQNWEIIGGPEL
jgi:hypothetical protein